MGRRTKKQIEQQAKIRANKRALRQKRKEMGITSITLWVHEEDRPAVRQYIKKKLAARGFDVGTYGAKNRIY